MTQIASKRDADISPLDALRAAPKVKIRIHKTGDRNERGDVFVGVNGINYQIQRGEDVTVPEPVAKVLETAIQTLYEFDPETRARAQRQAQAYPFTYVN
jgi:hypothetical protein